MRPFIHRDGCGYREEAATAPARLPPPPPFTGKGCKFGKTASLTSGCLLYLPGASTFTPAAAALRRARAPSPLGKTGWEMLRGLPYLEESWEAESSNKAWLSKHALPRLGFVFILEVSCSPECNRAARTPLRLPSRSPSPVTEGQQDQCPADSWAPSYLPADPAQEIIVWSHLLKPLPGVGPHTPQVPSKAPRS